MCPDETIRAIDNGKFLYSAVTNPQDCSKRFTLYFPDRPVQSNNSTSSSSIYWTGPFPGIESPIEACALGGGGTVCALLKQLIKNTFYIKTLIKLFYEPPVIKKITIMMYITL